MTIKDFNRRLQSASDDLVPELLRIAKASIITRKGEIQSRVQETGLDADGKPFPPYTREYQQFKTDVGRYTGKVDFTLGNYSIGKRIAAVNRRKRKRRQIAAAFGQGSVGPLTGVNLDIEKALRYKRKIPSTGQLWGSIRLVHEEATNSQVLVRIAPGDDLNKKKAEGLSEKRGNFLRLNQQEKDNSLSDVEIGFQDYITKKIGTK